MTKTKIFETVPNFSVGRDMTVLEKIADCFRAKSGVRLLDYSADYDHNRSVVTAIGECNALCDALFNAIKTASELIDLREHNGEHPRIGAADVVPIIPFGTATMEEAIEAARKLGRRVGEELNIPVYMYEKAAIIAGRDNLSVIRQGEFENLAAKMQQPEWRPDFGPKEPHISAGASVIGARVPLIAYNIQLKSNDLAIAKAIAKKIRFSSGGLPKLKAIGVYLAETDRAQVSMNLTDYTVTSMFDAYTAVEAEAKRLGVEIESSELIGLAPEQAFLDTAVKFLKLENYTNDKVLDKRFFEEEEN